MFQLDGLQEWGRHRELVVGLVMRVSKIKRVAQVVEE